MDDVPRQHTRPQVAAYQGEKAFIPSLARHAGHQYLMVDLVEEFLHVQIPGDPIAFTDRLLYLLYGSMGRASRSKADIRLGKTSGRISA